MYSVVYRHAQWCTELAASSFWASVDRCRSFFSSASGLRNRNRRAMGRRALLRALLVFCGVSFGGAFESLESKKEKDRVQQKADRVAEDGRMWSNTQEIEHLRTFWRQKCPLRDINSTDHHAFSLTSKQQTMRQNIEGYCIEGKQYLLIFCFRLLVDRPP